MIKDDENDRAFASRPGLVLRPWQWEAALTLVIKPRHLSDVSPAFPSNFIVSQLNRKVGSLLNIINVHHS